MRPDEALARAIELCAMHGHDWAILNSDMETVWNIEADSRVDENDLTWPVIVHMRSGALDTEGIALLYRHEKARS